MKKLILPILVSILAIQSCNYNYNDAYQTHSQAGAWDIEKIEHFEWDTINNGFKLIESQTDAGYVHLYDNDRTSTIAYANNCHFKIIGSIDSWALTDINNATLSTEWVYWFAENNRLTIFNYEPSTQFEIGTIYTIEEIGKNSQKWYYYRSKPGGYNDKEVITVKRVRF